MHAVLSMTLLIIAIPPATAQALPGCEIIGVATIGLSGEHLEPIEPGDHSTTIIEWEYNAPATAFSLTPIPLRFSTSGAPDWANIIVSSTVEFIEVPPAQQTHQTGEVALTIDIDEEAPPGSSATVTFKADADEGTCVTAATAEAQVEFTVAEPEHSEDTATEDPSAGQTAASIPGLPMVLLAAAVIGTLVMVRGRQT